MKEARTKIQGGEFLVERGGKSFVTVRGAEVQLDCGTGMGCGQCVHFLQHKPSSAVNPESRNFGGWCAKNELTTAPGLLRCGGDDFERRVR